MNLFKVAKSFVVLFFILSFLVMSPHVEAHRSIFDDLDRAPGANFSDSDQLRSYYEELQAREFKPTFGSEIEFWSRKQVIGALKGPGRIVGKAALLQLGGLFHWSLLPLNVYGFKFAREQMSEEGLFVAMEKGANEAADIKFDQLLKLIRQHCGQKGDCGVTTQSHKTDYGREWDGFTVRYPDGWWFKVTKDIAVLEILMKPVTVEDYVRVWPRFQNDLYKNAKKVGLWVPKLDGPWNGGHINVGVQSSFGDDHLLLRNFVVDLINHNSLFNGLLVKDKQNARTFSWEEFGQLKAVVESYDRGQFRSVESFFEALGQAVKLDREHYFSIRRASLDNVHARTIEIRGFRSQKSASEYGRWIVLLHERMKYLRSLAKPIQLDPYAVAKEDKFSQVRKFRRYVSESNLPFAKYLELIPKSYKKHTKSFAYSAKERAMVCAGEFLF